MGKTYAGPGDRRAQPSSSSAAAPGAAALTTPELVALGELRGTAFAPFSVQQGVPRPEGVTWDAPWDRTQVGARARSFVVVLLLYV